MNAETIEAFLARGGTIKRLENGVMRDAELTPRQRINPDRSITNAERQARKLAAQAVPIPHSRLGKERPPAPKAPRPSRGTGKREARKKAILAELAGGPVSPQFLAGALGIDENQVSVYMRRLKDEGKVVAYGGHSGRKWGLPCP